MVRSLRTSAPLAAWLFVIGLLPSAALADDRHLNPPDDPAFFYLFQAEPLGFPQGIVQARFELRRDDRVEETQEVLLSFEGRRAIAAPMRLAAALADGASGADGAQILVFADDSLLAVFDRKSLASYSRNLRYRDFAGLRRTAAEGGAPALERGPVEGILCGSPCGGGCGPLDDYDCDGVANSVDNCTDDPNRNQADCDGDGAGDVCDGLNAIYQNTGSIDTCMADKDNHVFYTTFEHHVEQRQVDVSSCGAPDRWNRWVRSDADCFGISDEDCCLDGIGGSIAQVGDNPFSWCGPFMRDIDFCH